MTAGAFGVGHRASASPGPGRRVDRRQPARLLAGGSPAATNQCRPSGPAAPTGRADVLPDHPVRPEVNQQAGCRAGRGSHPPIPGPTAGTGEVGRPAATLPVLRSQPDQRPVAEDRRELLAVGAERRRTSARSRGPGRSARSPRPSRAPVSASRTRRVLPSKPATSVRPGERTGAPWKASSASRPPCIRDRPEDEHPAGADGQDALASRNAAQATARSSPLSFS